MIIQVSKVEIMSYSQDNEAIKTPPLELEGELLDATLETYI